MFSNRKSQVFMMVLVVVTLIAFTVLYTVMISKKGGFDRSLGESQFSIWKANAKAQKALFYIDQSAVYASNQALYQLAQQGGHDKSECGDYIGHALWNNRTHNCYPEKPDEVFYDEFRSKLNGFLVLYSEVDLKSTKHELFVSEKKLYGKAHSPIVIDIIDEGSE